MGNRSLVHIALRQVGFVPLGELDWIYRNEEIVCAIPREETGSFEQAIRFLMAGSRQKSLQYLTRRTYLRLSLSLQEHHESSKKEAHERQLKDKRIC